MLEARLPSDSFWRGGNDFALTLASPDSALSATLRARARSVSGDDEPRLSMFPEVAGAKGLIDSSLRSFTVRSLPDATAPSIECAGRISPCHAGSGGIDTIAKQPSVKRTRWLAPPLRCALAVKVNGRGDEAEPSVWRRLWVPDTLTLAKLGRGLQAAMGWTKAWFTAGFHFRGRCHGFEHLGPA
jgi:hypothetical protein